MLQPLKKLQNKQLEKQQKALDKRRKKGAKINDEACAAVTIQRWYRKRQKKKRQQQEEDTVCFRLRQWWNNLGSGADTFYHKHMAHDAKPTLAELAKKKQTVEGGEHQLHVYNSDKASLASASSLSTHKDVEDRESVNSIDKTSAQIHRSSKLEIEAQSTPVEQDEKQLT